MRTTKFLLPTLLLLLGLTAAGLAQDQNQDDVNRIDLKFLRLEKSTYILPLLLTKSQLGELLLVIEKARADVKAEYASERKILAPLEEKLDKAIEDAEKKQQMANPTLDKELASAFAAVSISRNLVATMNGQAMYKAILKVCNKGQRKAMSNSFHPAHFGMNVKPDEMKEDDKLYNFGNFILLDPASYPVLIAIYNNAKD